MKFFKRKACSDRKRGFLQRLARNAAGNTAAIMGAALIPLLGFTGAAVDTARLYVVKVRLQQACDAGALAGRKMMTGTSLDDAAKAQAQAFFKNNFRSGWFSTTNAQFTATDTNDGQVQGTASVSVPVTLMSIFGSGAETLTATCEARKEIGDVDVMFVLDTTGSMSCAPSASATCVGSTQTYTRPDGTTGYYAQEQSGSKISALRQAVLDFYDALQSAADPTTHIRYGFVPYTSVVNIGKDLPSNLLSSNGGDYQTRRVISDSNVGSATSSTQTGVSQTACNALAGRSPATPLTYSWDGS
ncbi:MAG TPA: pilus assembly protein TadG-related protein, partial [Sphingomonas sp.]|nr:pilus assembly protein TadG-related protein [Sphingomonas sp.]